MSPHLPIVRALFVALAVWLAAAGALATPIIDGSFAVLSGGETVVDFDEIPLVPFQTVTNEFAAFGITFAPNVWFEDHRFFPNFDGAGLANFRSSAAPGGGLPPINPITVSFVTPMTDFAAYFAANTGDTITLTAMLGAAVVESFTFTDTACCAGHVLGFEDIVFDSVVINGSSLFIMDEFHFENVMEPANSLLLFAGLSGLALAGRRRV